MYKTSALSSAGQVQDLVPAQIPAIRTLCVVVSGRQICMTSLSINGQSRRLASDQPSPSAVMPSGELPARQPAPIQKISLSINGQSRQLASDLPAITIGSDTFMELLARQPAPFRNFSLVH
ncbi:hypothetical protein CR158_10320 [Halomonas heilongjiangensis]|nr:hypothetical protein CR158_10320 [Halomonas heilongjiangensis]